MIFVVKTLLKTQKSTLNGSFKALLLHGGKTKIMFYPWCIKRGFTLFQTKKLYKTLKKNQK